jgi:hypothetical protein
LIPRGEKRGAPEQAEHLRRRGERRKTKSARHRTIASHRRENHEALIVASSFDTRFALLKDEEMERTLASRRKNPGRHRGRESRLKTSSCCYQK